MKKVLIVSLTGLRLEGITSVILNYASHMNRDGLELAFTAFGKTPEVVRNKFEALGTVYDLPDRKKNTVAYVRNLSKLLKSNHYDVIHVHGNSGTMLIEAVLARTYGIKRVILHCHNTTCNHPLLNKVMTPFMKWMATDCVACSIPAGEWLYGDSLFTVFHNAIDLEKYSFDTKARQDLREEFGVGNEILIGHIGHFTEQKNHLFLIDAFEAFHKKQSASKLLLVSDGRLFDNVKKKVQMLGLEDSVIFAGRRADCDRLYQTMDLFVLPSKWEGLSLVTVEAQASSLPTLVSAAVPAEARCTNLVEWLDLEEGAEKWAEKMAQMMEKSIDRTVSRQKELGAAGFDIRQEAEKLRELYLKS